MSIPMIIVGWWVNGWSDIDHGMPPNLAHIWVNILLQIDLNPFPPLIVLINTT